MLRSPEELILEALKKTNGDQLKLNQLFPSKIGRRAVTGFASIYHEAGGGQKGLDAVDAEFRRLSSAAMTQEEVTRAFTAQMDAAQSKVQIFNNEVQGLVEQLSTGLLPAFEAVGPPLIELATWISGRLADLMGVTKPKQEREATSTQNSALNTLSNLHAWERGNLVEATPVTGGALQERTAANMKDAAPLLASLKKQADASEEAAKPFESNVEAQRLAFTPTGDPMSGAAPAPLTEDEIKQLAAGGDNDALQYVNDKATLSRLHDTIGDLHTGIRALTDALTSGKIIVKMPKAPTKARTGGVEAAESPEPE